MDAEQPKNHPHPAGLGLVVWGRAFGGVQHFIFCSNEYLDGNIPFQ